MFTKLVVILRMIRFSQTVFALPFALMAAFLAGNNGQAGFCGWEKLILIVLCMALARSAAMGFNRIVDAKLDARNPRTANREIPRGKISTKEASFFVTACAILFIGSTFLFYQPIGPWFGFGNFYPLAFSLPALLFICLYSFTKRFTWASHFYLGASLMLAPLATWIAVSPPAGPMLSWEVLLLGLAVLLWVAGFDIIYACQDVHVDRREKLHSLPARLGVNLAIWISRTCHSLTVTALLALALITPLGKIYLAAVAAVAALLICEHILVSRGRVKLAFDLNGAVGIILAVATIADVLTRTT